MSTPLIPRDSVDALIAQRLPDWMAAARADHLQALHASLRRQQRAQQRLQDSLGPLTPLEQFAEAALGKALADSHGQALDARKTRLVRTLTQLVPPVSPSLPLRYTTSIERYDLLSAALHNFEEDEALPDGLGTSACLENAAGTCLAVKAEAFARLCRQLDIGEQYQGYLRERFARLIPGVEEGVTAARDAGLLQESIAANLEVAVRRARLRGELDERACLQLLPLVSPEPVVAAVSGVLQPRQVLLLGKLVQGMAAFAVYPDAHSTQLERVIAWVPGDPQGELLHAPDWAALYAALQVRLRDPAYAAFFQRLIGEHQRSSFATALAHATADGADTGLDGRDVPISGELFDYLARLQVARHLDDAQVLAVPTRLVDKAARDARLQAYLAAGLDLLGLASLFVPGLNALMLGIAALQVTDDLYEGYASWQLGDREAALEHLFAVAGLVAAGVLVGGGLALAGGVARRLAWVDGLRLVRGAGGRVRLAAREPRDYRLGSETAAGRLRQVDQGWQLALPDGTFALTRDTPSHPWRIRHPRQADRALLRVEGHPRGGWRHALEQPEAWQDLRLLLQRLDTGLAGLTEQEAQVISTSTGLDAARLRRLHLDNAPAPARLLDALQRYRLRRSGSSPSSDEITRQMMGEVGSLSAGARTLRRDFPGLSRRACEEIVARGSSVARQKLLVEQRVPLAMAEQARWQLRDSRVDQACLELHLQGRLSRDAERLAMALSADLAALGADVRLALRQGSLDGELLSAHGAEEAPQVRTLIASQAGYQPVDSSGAPLPGSTDDLSLGEALWYHLDSAQRAAIQPATTSAQALARRWQAAASTRRAEVAGWIGLASTGSGVRPPVRLGDGRLGYVLGGLGHSSRQALLQGLRQVFPSLDDAQLQGYLGERLAAGDNLWSHVEDLHRQLEQMHEQLARWQQGAADLEQRTARERVAALVLRGWRRQADSPLAAERLLIEGERIGSLPRLPAGVGFAHVRHLALRNLGLDRFEDGWLRCFSGVRRLDLSGNHLTGLPSELASLHDVTELDLSDNRLVLGDGGNRLLDGLGTLQSLNLNRNPLAEPGELPGLARLRRIHLRDTGLHTVPALVTRQGGLEFADLRNNHIVDLGEALFSLPARVREHIVLHDNPLSAQSQARLQALGAGAQPALPRLWRHLVGDLDARSAWCDGLAPQTRALRQAQWDNLAREPGSQDLLRLLSDLRGSDDYRHQRLDLQRRVWLVVEACEQDARLREVLFELAALPRSCSDSVALNFSHLEVQVLAHQYAGGHGGAAAQAGLIELGRGLFRLDEVDRAAALDIQDRQARGVFVDEVEVRLAYRSGLAQALGLPGQPAGMRYSSFADVSPVQLNSVRGQVLTAQRTPQLVESLAAREFWQAYLYSRHAQRFAALDEPFFERMEAFDAARGDLPDSEYLEAMNRLGVEREAARASLISQLTREALQAAGAAAGATPTTST